MVNKDTRSLLPLSFCFAVLYVAVNVCVGVCVSLCVKRSLALSR